jgi:hypothetical protein
MRPVLVLALAVATSGCSLFDHAGTCPCPRRYYLTKKTFQGNEALGACASGYHMASRFEIADLSGVVYDVRLGVVSDDSGAGPPSMAATYTSAGPTGWIRTGGDARYTASADPPDAATVNCAAWSTASASARGTIAYLTDRFAVENGAGVVWTGGSDRCDERHHVWCVGDFPARDRGDDDRFRWGRRRHDDAAGD